MGCPPGVGHPLGCECPPAPAVGRRLLLDFAPERVPHTRRTASPLEAMGFACSSRSENLPDREAWPEELFRMKAHMDVREGESDMDVRPSRHSEQFLGPRPPEAGPPSQEPSH